MRLNLALKVHVGKFLKYYLEDGIKRMYFVNYQREYLFNIVNIDNDNMYIKVKYTDKLAFIDKEWDITISNYKSEAYGIEGVVVEC